MEIWLSWQNNRERLRLPVLPPSFEVVTSNMNTRVNISELGNINLIGKSDLREMTIESFFPNQEYYFVEYSGFPKPYSCTEMIEGWRNSGKPIRLIITGTPINIAMGIENFSYGEPDGTGDVYYNLELAEYVFTEVRQSASSSEYKQDNKRPSKEIAKNHVVKPGDTLWAIAKRTTGDGSNYKEIAKKNNIKDPNIIKPGQELIL